MECLGHIVVELVAVGPGMHDDDGSVERRRVCRDSRFHEIEIGHGGQVVVFCGIGVEAYELDAVGDEAEVCSAENSRVALIASAQKVVVADDGHIGLVELAKQVAHPFELFVGARVGKVTTVNHKVDSWLVVDVVDDVASVAVPSVGIAHYCDAQRVFLCT